MSIVRVGTDPSKRPILMSTLMRDWWAGVTARLGFEPTILQGAYMAKAGDGAEASQGYHDGSGCLDLRTRDRTVAEIAAIIRITRAGGAGSWVRDRIHGGMDPHIHLVLGDDLADADPGAAWQWTEYLAGRDGLKSRGRDYHPRPSPLVTTIPEDWIPMTPEQAKQLADTLAEVLSLRARFDKFAASERARDQRLKAWLKDRLARNPDKGALKQLLAEVDQLIPDEE